MNPMRKVSLVLLALGLLVTAAFVWAGVVYGFPREQVGNIAAVAASGVMAYVFAGVLWILGGRW